MKANESVEKAETVGVEITRGVYDVARLFLDSGYRDFSLCEKNAESVKPGDVVVFQQNSKNHLSPGFLRVGYVQSIIVSPVSGRTTFYMKLFSVSRTGNFFKSTQFKSVRVEYEQMRLKLVEPIVRDGIGIFVKKFRSLPSLDYFE